MHMRHRCYLPLKHQFRNMMDQFNGEIEKRYPPLHFSGHDVYEMVKDVYVVLGKGEKASKSAKNEMWKKKSIQWELPYWKDLDVYHSIDVMHVEKNVCESFLGTLLNMDGKTKDNRNVRAVLKKMGIRPKLWLDDSEKEQNYPHHASPFQRRRRKSFVSS